MADKILRSMTFPGLEDRYTLPFAHAIESEAQNDPDNSIFETVIPDAEEAPLLSALVKGKTAAVNQFVQNGNFADTSNWNLNLVSLSASGNIATITVTTSNTGAQITQSIGFVSGHKYLIRASLNPSVNTTETKIRFNSGNQDAYVGALTASTWTDVAVIVTANAGGGALRIYTDNGTAMAVDDTLQVKNVNLIDLSLIFTATELTTIGTDVSALKSAWIKKYGTPLPQYIPYNAGSLVSNNAVYQLTGRNLCKTFFPQGTYGATITKNGETYTLVKVGGGGAFIDWAIKQGQTYTLSFTVKSGSITNCRIYSDTYSPTDATRVQDLSNSGGTFTANGNGYIRFWFSGTLVLENVQLELGETATVYEPYYNGGSIDCSAAPLNGVGTAVDEQDVEQGTVTRAVGTGTISVSLVYSPTGLYDFAVFTVPSAWASITNMFFSEKIIFGGITFNSTTDGLEYRALVYDTQNRQIAVSMPKGTTLAQAQALFDGITFAYPLATPTTEIITPQALITKEGYNLLQAISGDVQSGEVELTYVESIKGYVDKKIAEALG